MKNYQIEFEKWLASDKLTESERRELLSIQNDEETKELRFGAPMDFGTAGLRSTMYMGIGCMNRFTVAHTTRGIAALIKAEGGEDRGVAIAYDSRNNSEQFARVSACVLAGAGIKSFIFNGLRPTPELSYAVRETGALAGINITASHNPKEYNGYKAYWEDGAQLAPEHAQVVANERCKFDCLDTEGIADFDEAVKSGLITILDEEFDAKYLDEVVATLRVSATSETRVGLIAVATTSSRYFSSNFSSRMVISPLFTASSKSAMPSVSSGSNLFLSFATTLACSGAS